MRTYFSDFFNVDRSYIEAYGAIDIPLVSDIPLFIDPFLIFQSDKDEYKKLHAEIIKYLTFLRNKSGGNIGIGELKAWYMFNEVRQNWLGYSSEGNYGRGLDMVFAKSLNNNLSDILQSFGNEVSTKSPHLEKLVLIEKGIGKDKISDFTVNLIKGYLLEYTEEFTKRYIKVDQQIKLSIPRVYFDYILQKWMPKSFTLPRIKDDFVLLTPDDILTRDEMWISKENFSRSLNLLPQVVENEQLRAEINNYILSQLKDKPTQKEIMDATINAAKKYPQLIDVYILSREQSGPMALKMSSNKVEQIKKQFIHEADLAIKELRNLNFYNFSLDSFSEAKSKALILKEYIEYSDGFRLFYDKDKLILSREKDLQLLYKLIWKADPGKQADINPEANHGRGSVDFAVSNGAKDKSWVEFKLAKNKDLKRNLQKQIEVYQKADVSTTYGKKLYVITFFTEKENEKLNSVLSELSLLGVDWIVKIDAQKDNKVSGSKS